MSYNEYLTLKQYFKELNQIVDDFGNVITPSLYLIDINKEEFNINFSPFIHNFYLDFWLIRHCNIPFIQNYLCDKYGSEFIYNILNNFTNESKLEDFI